LPTSSAQKNENHVCTKGRQDKDLQNFNSALCLLC